jgi:hypothetical protein
MPARRIAAAAGCLAFASLFALAARAVPLEPEELAAICAQADGPAHCGRLVEEVQLKRLPNLAVRDGAALRVSLYPSGTVTFGDTDAPNGGRSYNLWDFISEINAVVLYATEGDEASFVLVQRATGRKADLPAEPKVSPDRSRLVTADFCEKRCVNELAVWRVTRDGVRKEYSWAPKQAWTDSAANWKDADTVVVQYTPAGTAAPSKLERRLNDPSWLRH